MKKLGLIITVTLVILILTGFIFLQQHKPEEFSNLKRLDSFKNTEFTTTLESPLNVNKNCIYASTLLYAWEELRSELGPDIVVDDSFKDLKVINESKSFLNTLKRNEYKNSVEIKQSLIMFRSEFGKLLDFEEKFEKIKDGMIFDDKKVAAFGIQKKILNLAKILYYEDGNHFILKLTPKDSEHEIILYKPNSLEISSFSDLIYTMNTKIKTGIVEQLNPDFMERYMIFSGDELAIPCIEFNIEHDYQNLIKNRFIANSSDYSIELAHQKIAFKLNEKGAEIKSESIFGVKSKKPDIPFKKLLFDKPFLILLKRVEYNNPYFAMWVSNSETMIAN